MGGKGARFLQRAPKLGRGNTHHPPEDLREVARVLVTDVKADLDQAAPGFADELLGRVIDPPEEGGNQNLKRLYSSCVPIQNHAMTSSSRTASAR